MPNAWPKAEPFYFAGNRTGCLLIHGFTGTPYAMHEFGERLAAQGYTVLEPALAGHATRRQDLLPTRWHDGYDSVTRAYDQLREHCDPILVLGLSLGGVLALHLAAHRAVAGGVAVSAPFTLSNPLLPLFHFFPGLYNVIPTIAKGAADMDAVDRSILTQHRDDPASPTRAAASLIRDLLPHVQNDSRDVLAPMLLIQSRGDRTIPANSMNAYDAHIGARDKTRLGIERRGHLVLEDVSTELALTPF